MGPLYILVGASHDTQGDMLAKGWCRLYALNGETCMYEFVATVPEDKAMLLLQTLMGT